jgi:hypothetical protein
MFSREVLRNLVTAEQGRSVISIYARTDPRDPANTSGTPAWHVALRNGLSVLAERLEAGDDREDRLAFRTRRGRIEQELVNLDPAERARSVAWFVGIDGASSQRLSLRLPVRRDTVVCDTRPFVSPLVDIADRGALTGVVLVTGDLVRLMQIEQGEPNEPADSTYELSLGDWRPFGGSAAGSSARGTRTVSHQERYEARVEAQRDHLFETAATQTAQRLDNLGWERIVLVSEGQVASRFREALPPELGHRVIAESDHNLVGDEPSAIADALEPLLEDAWLRRTTALVEQAREHAQAGGAATVGAQETFGALAEGRVEHLVLDPDHDFSAAAGMIPAAIGGPADMLGERAVETAIATAAQVTAIATTASDTLRNAGGMAALLRY